MRIEPPLPMMSYEGLLGSRDSRPFRLPRNSPTRVPSKPGRSATDPISCEHRFGMRYWPQSRLSRGWRVAVNTKAPQISALSESHATALQDSALLLTRFFFDAVNDLKRGVGYEDTWLAEYLPARYRARYDDAFGRQFLTCFLTVSAQLWSSEPYRPTCVADQLAFRALLEFAQAALEERGIEPEFGPAWEKAFDNLGVDALFDVAHAVEPRLEFANWFRTLDSADPVHPSIRFQDRVVTRIS